MFSFHARLAPSISTTAKHAVRACKPFDGSVRLNHAMSSTGMHANQEA